MQKRSKAPARAPGGALPGAEDAFRQAPMLTPLWGRFLACLGILTVVAFTMTAFKPEAGAYFISIYSVAVAALLLAADRKLLD